MKRALAACAAIILGSGLPGSGRTDSPVPTNIVADSRESSLSSGEWAAYQRIKHDARYQARASAATPKRVAQARRSRGAGIRSILMLLLDKSTSDESPTPGPGACSRARQSGVGIINLDHVIGFPEEPLVCTGRLKFDLDQCVTELVRSALPAECRTRIDVFVPGTTQEDGNWKQFRSLVNGADDRGSLSLRYDTATKLDQLKYDNGVKKSRDALKILLRVLAERFGPEEVRVFGHSKGAHGVTLVADELASSSKYDDFEFYAFGQAGRVAVDIDNSPEIKPGRLGKAGYIHKLSRNLVGITWENDEVRDYRGDGFNGLKLPLSWRYPGYILGHDKFGSGLPLYTRIDHHNTYGGGYTEEAVPYCNTGSGFALAPLRTHPCIKKANTAFPAYFWGHQACRDTAFEMMRAGAVNETSWIGASGPRASSTSCRERQSRVSASYVLRYRYNRADKDCIFNFRLRARGRNSPGPEDARPDGGSITFTEGSDVAVIPGSTAKVRTGSILIPYSTKLTVEAWLTREPGIGNCDSIFQTESYIQEFSVSFTDPGTGRRVNRTLIGNLEGAAYPVGNVHDKDKNGWERNAGSWNLEYDTVFQALKIEGGTSTSSSNRIFMGKVIHLID